MTFPPNGNAPLATSRPPATPIVPGQGAPGMPPSASSATATSPGMEPQAGAPNPSSGFAPDVHAYLTQRQQQHAEEIQRVQAEAQDAGRYKAQLLAMAQNPAYASVVLDFLDGKPAPGGAARSPNMSPPFPGAPGAPGVPSSDVDPEIAAYVQSQLQSSVGQAVAGLKNEIAGAFKPYQQQIEGLAWQRQLEHVQHKYGDVGEYAAEIKQMIARHPSMDLEMAYRNVAFDKAQERAATRGKEEGIRLGAIQAMSPSVGTAEPPLRTGVTSEARKGISDAMKSGNTYDATALAYHAALAEVMAEG